MTTPRLHHEMLIAGFGGQGVVLAGKLVSMAALAEGREVVWAPSYGPEMRGGPVHCTIIVSEDPIGSPEVSLADSLLIMDSASLERFRARIKPGGLLLLNTSLVPRPADLDSAEIIEIPATQIADDLGDSRVANVIMLGAFLRLRPILSTTSIIDAMRTTAGKTRQHLLAINQTALDKGASLAKPPQ